MPKELSIRKEQIQETSLSLASAGLFAHNILFELRILIDYIDSTDGIKAAHFSKNQSIRITDSPEVVALHDARTIKKVKWQKIR